MSSLKLKAAPTFRDLGGITTADGRQVRYGQFFRAGHLLSPDSADEARIRNLGLRRVCDLRSAAERQKQPSAWGSYSTALTLECDVNADVRSGHGGLLHLLQSNLSAQGAREMMLHTYRNFSQGFESQLRVLFDTLLDEQGTPVLVHCTAGKDRTGFACALVLHALGVDSTQIYADYLSTGDVLVNSAVADSLADFLSQILGRCPDPAAIDVIMRVDAAYLEAALAALNTAYGSIDHYLVQAGGLTPARREQLRQRLLD